MTYSILLISYFYIYIVCMVSLLLLLFLFHLSLFHSFQNVGLSLSMCGWHIQLHRYIYINAPRKCNTNTHRMLYFKEDRSCVNSTKRETYIYGLYLASSSHADAKILYPPPIYVVYCTYHASFSYVLKFISLHMYQIKLHSFIFSF